MASAGNDKVSLINEMARDFLSEPVEAWPEHTTLNHLEDAVRRRTYDEKCVRCVLERIASAQPISD